MRYLKIATLTVALLLVTAFVLQAATVDIKVFDFTKYKVRWGETLGLRAGLTNNTSQRQVFKFWAEATYLGVPMGEMDPTDARVPPNFDRAYTWYKKVPSMLFPGEYCVYVHIGPYPQQWDQDSDCFKVVLFSDEEGECRGTPEETARWLMDFIAAAFGADDMTH